jgi:hypothetical protein
MAEGKKKPTSFRLSPRALGLLKEAADLERRSMANALELAIEDYHERVVKEQGKGDAAAA